MLISYSNIQQLLPSVIEGKVTSIAGIPITGAHVYFVPRIEESITTDNGDFKLTTWMALPVTLVVCHKNYESHKITLTNVAQKLHIELRQK